MPAAGTTPRTDREPSGASAPTSGSIGRLGSSPASTRPSHTISNVRVELIDADTALIRAYVRADHVLVNHHGDHVFTIAGYYDDRLVLTSHRWRIQSKKLVVRWSEGNRHIMYLAAEKAAAVGHGQ